MASAFEDSRDSSHGGCSRKFLAGRVANPSGEDLVGGKKAVASGEWVARGEKEPARSRRLGTALRKRARVGHRAAYHSTRSMPGTRSKCRSRLASGMACWRQSAAIQRSFEGIGLPFFFSSRPMAA